MANEHKVKDLLKVIGNQEGADVSAVIGSSGLIWKITDSLTGELLGIRDISGFPCFIVNSDGRAIIGNITDNGIDDLQVKGTSKLNGLKYTNAIGINSGTDLNNLIEAGFYAGGGLVNVPVGVNQALITTESWASGTSIRHQTLTCLDNNANFGKIFTRVRDSSGWTSWAQIQTATSGNIKTRKDITGTSYTIINSDVDKILYTTNSSPVTITIPAGLTTNQEYEVIQYGSGQVSFVSSGTTLKYLSYEIPSIVEINGRITISYIDTETYQLIGDLSMI